MKIDLSNPPYAVKLKELGFAYSYTDCEKGVIVYTHASPRLVGSPWIDCWDDMECIIDFEDENCMKPYSMPVYSNDIEAVPDGYGNITIAPKLNYETVTDIIMHLSNQLNDDIKATVHGDTELVIEVNGK